MPVFGFQPIPIRSQKPPYLMAMPILQRRIYMRPKHNFHHPPDKRN